MLLDPMFDIPGSDIVDVIIDGSVVIGDKKPQYVHRPTELSHPPAKELDIVNREKFAANQ